MNLSHIIFYRFQNIIEWVTFVDCLIIREFEFRDINSPNLPSYTDGAYKAQIFMGLENTKEASGYIVPFLRRLYNEQ